MTDLDRLVAVQTVKEGSILGRLCWYTVPEDIWVSRGELVKAVPRNRPQGKMASQPH